VISEIGTSAAPISGPTPGTESDRRKNIAHSPVSGLRTGPLMTAAALPATRRALASTASTDAAVTGTGSGAEDGPGGNHAVQSGAEHFAGGPGTRGRCQQRGVVARRRFRGGR
jgi:hypothetical protein